MDVVDRAGNKRTYESNDVIISNINVSNFKITDVVNPAIYASETFETREWPFNGEHVSMLAGSNFDFEIHYDLSDVNPNRYKITGEYRITIVDDGEEIYRSEPVPYHPNDHPSGEHHRKGDKDEDGHGYFATTFTLPSIDENDQPFSETAKVYISSELKRTEIADGTVITTTFENELSEYGNLIGILGHYGEGGSVSIDDMIRFNQRH